MWDKISYPFPNFSGATVEVWEWINNFISQYIGHVMRLNLFPVSKRGLCSKGPLLTVNDNQTAGWNQPSGPDFNSSNKIGFINRSKNNWKQSSPYPHVPLTIASNRRVIPAMWFSLYITLSWARFILKMVIAILITWYLYTETALDTILRSIKPNLVI